MSGSIRDVAVVGDGPAGSALAAALRTVDVDAVLIGRDDAWGATYGTWLDDLDDVAVLAGADVTAARIDGIVVVADRRREIDRTYGVIDNGALRTHLRDGVDHRSGEVAGIEPDRVRFDDGASIEARVVVDARGRSLTTSTGPRQTAFGVVLDTPPDGPLGEATLMDWSTPPGVDADDVPVPTFGYALPLEDGWLVEETVLAADPPVEPDRLLPLLAARLSTTADELSRRARRVERVDIPMWAPVSARGQVPPAFGAAAGLIHPATGYSLATSLRLAEPMASAITAHIGGEAAPPDVWTQPMRRTRALHDYGLDVLVRLDRHEIGGFFGAFFDLPTDRWARYLRVDTPPSAISATMLGVFARADWGLRRRLVSANPRAFARLIRP